MLHSTCAQPDCLKSLTKQLNMIFYLPKKRISFKHRVFPDTFMVGALSTIPLSAFDEEGDALTWTVLDQPASMSIIDTTLIWAPLKAEEGLDTLTIIVSDGLLSDTLIKPVVIYDENSVAEKMMEMPKALSLSASPNPANPTVNLTVGIPASMKQAATVQIFGINGKVVRSWQLSGAGYHKIAWNGRDNSNTAISSGLYLVRVSGTGKVLQRKVLLLK